MTPGTQPTAGELVLGAVVGLVAGGLLAWALIASASAAPRTTPLGSVARYAAGGTPSAGKAVITAESPLQVVARLVRAVSGGAA